MSAHKIVNRKNSLHVFEPSVNLESILRSYNKNNYLRSPLFAWTTFYKKVWKHVNFKWKFTCFINHLWTATININSPIPTDTTFWRVYRNHLVRLSIRLYVQLYLVHIFLIEKNWRFLLNTNIAYDHRVWHVFYPSSFLQAQGYWKKKKCNNLRPVYVCLMEEILTTQRFIISLGCVMILTQPFRLLQVHWKERKYKLFPVLTLFLKKRWTFLFHKRSLKSIFWSVCTLGLKTYIFCLCCIKELKILQIEH